MAQSVCACIDGVEHPDAVNFHPRRRTLEVHVNQVPQGIDCLGAADSGSAVHGVIQSGGAQDHPTGLVQVIKEVFVVSGRKQPRDEHDLERLWQ